MRRAAATAAARGDSRKEVRYVSVLIKGGRIITAADDYVGDVFVEGERITTRRASRSTSTPTA